MGEVFCEALRTNRTLTTLKIDGDLNDAEVGAFDEALQMNPAIVTLRFDAPLGQEALAALSRNRELSDLWASVARVVLRGAVPELRAVVDAISPKKFQEDVFRFFWPKPAGRSRSPSRATSCSSQSSNRTLKRPLYEMPMTVPL